MELFCLSWALFSFLMNHLLPQRPSRNHWPCLLLRPLGYSLFLPLCSKPFLSVRILLMDFCGLVPSLFFLFCRWLFILRCGAVYFIQPAPANQRSAPMFYFLSGRPWAPWGFSFWLGGPSLRREWRL